MANTDWFLANFLSPFLRRHLQRGVAITAISPPGPFVRDIRHLGVGWAEWPLTRGRGAPASWLDAIRSLRRTIDQVNPDLVHLITAMPILLGRLALRRDQKRICVLPGLGRAFVSSSAVSAADRAVIRWGARWAAGSPGSRLVFHQDSDRRRILGRSRAAPDGTALIPGWGVELERFSGLGSPESPPLVVMVSRMLRTKGVGEFIRAAGECRTKSAARFALIGGPDPGNPDSLEDEELTQWTTAEGVEWWGHRKDIAEILARASICVLPSKYGEGVPQSLIEAAAAGCPIVATDIPGCREVVEHGRNGILIRPGDVGELRAAILDLLSSPETRLSMGREGRRIAEERFSATSIFEAYLGLYAGLGVSLGARM